MNVLAFLITRAIHKHERQVALAPGTVTEIMLSEQVHDAWRQAFEYAGLLREARKSFSTEHTRRVRESGLSDTQYTQARIASGQMNLERAKVCEPLLLLRYPS